jgi:hypothetical protein
MVCAYGLSCIEILAAAEKAAAEKAAAEKALQEQAASAAKATQEGKSSTRAAVRELSVCNFSVRHHIKLGLFSPSCTAAP